MIDYLLYRYHSIIPYYSLSWLPLRYGFVLSKKHGYLVTRLYADPTIGLGSAFEAIEIPGIEYNQAQSRFVG